MYQLIIPRKKHRKMISFAHRKTRFRNKFYKWCLDFIGPNGDAWDLVMIRNGPDAPDYALRCPSKAHAILFHLKFKLYLVDSGSNGATSEEG